MYVCIYVHTYVRMYYVYINFAQMRYCNIAPLHQLGLYVCMYACYYVIMCMCMYVCMCVSLLEFLACFRGMYLRYGECLVYV